jgi:hypothetical protein
MKTLPVKMVTVALIGKGGYNETCRVWYIECMKLIVNFFFVADILFLGVVLDLDTYIFPWQTCFFLGRSS